MTTNTELGSGNHFEQSLSSQAEAARQRLETAVSGLFAQFLPIPETVQETRHVIKSHDGADITIYEFSRIDIPISGDPSAAFLYIHGGGNISCSIEAVCRPGIAQFANEFGIRTFAVEFRLAPEHPHPAPIEDCYAGLKWLMDNAASTLNVDPNRIGLFGESGGGGLVAALSLLARDRKLSPPIAKQILAYPMLDDRSSKRHFNPQSKRDESLRGFVDLIDICWSAYLPNGSGLAAEDVSSYAAPARAIDLTGLPATYIDVGGNDWFRAESLEFAGRLAKADIDVELHVYPGMPHCFEWAAPDSPVVRNAKDNRLRAIRSV